MIQTISEYYEQVDDGDGVDKYLKSECKLDSLIYITVLSKHEVTTDFVFNMEGDLKETIHILPLVE